MFMLDFLKYKSLKNFKNLLSIVFFCFYQKISSQPIAEKNFPYEAIKILHDSGVFWNNLSSIRSIRRENLSATDEMNIHIPSSYYKILVHDKKAAFNIQKNINFTQYFYVYYDVIFYQNYFGASEKRRSNKELTFMLNSSGIGFYNDWVVLQIGKGVESWGINH